MEHLLGLFYVSLSFSLEAVVLGILMMLESHKKISWKNVGIIFVLAMGLFWIGGAFLVIIPDHFPVVSRILGILALIVIFVSLCRADTSKIPISWVMK